MRKRTRAAIAAAAAVLLAFTGIAAINTVVQSGGSKYIVEADRVPADVEAIVVPGARVFPDGRVSGILYDRLTVALELANKYEHAKLLLSGDHGRKDYDEVNTMKRWMESRGVSSDRIFMDHAGFSTYETMYRAKSIFQAHKIVIVTQRYHLTRAVYDARMLGMSAYGVTSDLNRYRGMSRFELREVAARSKDFLYVQLLRPEPTYLGEPIPLSGDSRLTFDQ
jgi:vancomycin permeability regulator SanA